MYSCFSDVGVEGGVSGRALMHHEGKLQVEVGYVTRTVTSDNNGVTGACDDYITL